MSLDPPSFPNTTAKGIPAVGKNSVVTMGTMRTAALQITTAAAGATDGTTLSTQPVITLVDKFGNTLSNDTRNVSVTVFLGQGVITGTNPTAAVAGVATFTDIAIDAAPGVQVQLKYHAQGAQHIVQDAEVAIAAGAAATAQITTAPVGAASGSALSVQPVITLYDVDGRVAASTINVVCAKKSGTGTLSGTTTVAAVNGVATFTNLVMTTAGTYVLSFTPTSLTEVDSGTLTTS